MDGYALLQGIFSFRHFVCSELNSEPSAPVHV